LKRLADENPLRHTSGPNLEPLAFNIHALGLVLRAGEA